MLFSLGSNVVNADVTLRSNQWQMLAKLILKVSQTRQKVTQQLTTIEIYYIKLIIFLYDTCLFASSRIWKVSLQYPQN